MLETWTSFLNLMIAACMLFFVRKRVWGHASGLSRGFFSILCVCSILVSFSAAELCTPKQTLTVTALNRRNEASEENAVYIVRFEVNGEKREVPEPVEGKWKRDGWYKWFDPQDDRREPGTTDSVRFSFGGFDEVKIVFWSNIWKGQVSIQANGQATEIDCYQDTKEGIEWTVPSPQTKMFYLSAVLCTVAAFSAALAVLLYLSAFLAKGVEKTWGKLLNTQQESSALQKFQRYQFLFEELVSRDFKKKYKRTVLGMAWSVLSPLLTLLVMALVFTRFFGRNTAHYIIYLFCGNLVFSYFNESTTQGMTSLMGNASIFTKVNVPKYLFLFSKNVQTLINFGLTLCVFFVFCILDKVPFTWKFILLLYPIALLVLFNIGMGLILSALFVFFRDIQYLWSVFTMLLMYMSAIFYTIDSYPNYVQNLFLLNPVYLFIRYFRKIVIEATIPAWQFHLLMLADVCIALGLGCYMYKKYNTKFLYYV